MAGEGRSGGKETGWEGRVRGRGRGRGERGGKGRVRERGRVVRKREDDFVFWTFIKPCFSARVKAFCDSSGARSAGGRLF